MFERGEGRHELGDASDGIGFRYADLSVGYSTSDSDPYSNSDKDYSPM
jgi:hypothetical protein